jgi:prolipoprotein diacylglyceryl transferase
MFPNLSYLIARLFGTPVDNFLSVFQTFGLFLTLAFLSSAYVLYLEFKRKEKEGIFDGRKEKEIIGEGPKLQTILINAVIGFVLGAKLVFIAAHFPEFKENAASVVLSTKGSFLGGLAGLLILAGWKYWEDYKSKLAKPLTREKMVYPHQRVGDITIMAAIFGLLGARLFSILENFGDFIKDPIGQLFSGSGLTIYGGLILAFAAVYFYVQRLGMKPIHVMDAVAPALIMGYAVGRLGCHMSGDGDWGLPSTMEKPAWFILPEWMWSFDYPNNVIHSYNSDPVTGASFNDGVAIPDCGGYFTVDGSDPKYCTKLNTSVYPTPLWESILSFIIFGILWLLRKRVKVAGMLFFIYLIFNGFERFFIEGVRVNPHYKIAGLYWSMSQYIAFGLVLAGIAGCVVLWQYHKKNSLNKA